MRVISFYTRSRNMVPHIDEHGECHVPISEWDKLLTETRAPMRWKIRRRVPDYPTNGTTHTPASDA